MATLATVYGAVPDIPTQVVNVVVPVPPADADSFNFLRNVSPYTIRSAADGGTDLVTDCRPNGYKGGPFNTDDLRGVTSVVLETVATKAQIEAGLTITDTESPGDTAIVPDPQINFLANIQGIKVTAVGADGRYSATAKIDWSRTKIGKTYVRSRLILPMAAIDPGCVHGKVGTLEGFITYHTGIGVADFDLVWINADWEDPQGLNHFEEILFEVPDGFRLKPKQATPYTNEGAGTVSWLNASDGGNDSDTYAYRSQSAKVLRFSVFEDVSDDFPTWADAWVENKGYYSVSGNSATVTDQNAHNPDSPLLFHGGILPQYGDELVAFDEETMDDHIARVVAGTTHDYWGGDVDGFSGRAHRVYPKFGGVATGIFVGTDWHAQFMLTNALNRVAYLWAFTENVVDRHHVFVQYKGQPASRNAIMTRFGGNPKMTVESDTQDANKAVAHSWTSGPWNQNAPGNAPLTASGTQWEIERRWGAIKDMHLVRALEPILGLVEHHGDPLARLLLLYFGSAAIFTGPDPKQYSLGPGKGTSGGRAQAWIAYTAAAALTYVNNVFEADLYKDFHDHCWLYIASLAEYQMPNGGFGRWSDGNFEFTTARNQLYEEQYEILATALGKTVEELSRTEELQAEAAATIPEVVQPWQDGLLLNACWAAARATGREDDLTVGLVLLRGLWCNLTIYKDPLAESHDYRVGIVEKGKNLTHLVQSHSAVDALYSSPDYESGSNQYSRTYIRRVFATALMLTGRDEQEVGNLTLYRPIIEALIAAYDSDMVTQFATGTSMNRTTYASEGSMVHHILAHTQQLS